MSGLGLRRIYFREPPGADAFLKFADLKQKTAIEHFDDRCDYPGTKFKRIRHRQAGDTGCLSLGNWPSADGR